MVWGARVLPLSWDSSEARPSSWGPKQATRSRPLSFSSFPCLLPSAPLTCLLGAPLVYSICPNSLSQALCLEAST